MNEPKKCFFVRHFIFFPQSEQNLSRTEANMKSGLTAVKRQGYFARVRKRWKRRDVREINELHAKFMFTQYIRFGMRSFLTRHDKKKVFLAKEDYDKVVKHEFTCPKHEAPITFESYAPGVFYALRQRICLSTSEYLEIVSPQNPVDFYLEFLSNSKSGQSFFLTNNKQFMIKTVTKSEVVFFMRILKRYMDHFDSYPHSLLVKFVGVHSVQVRKFKKPVYFMVMLSIYYPGERIEQRYDIKGCLIGRFTKPETDSSSNVMVILKEQNLKDDKIVLGEQRDWFLRQIEADTHFLQSIGVLDYSLLVGMQPLREDERQESRDMAAIISRAQKSVHRDHSVFKSTLQRPTTDQLRYQLHHEQQHQQHADISETGSTSTDVSRRPGNSTSNASSGEKFSSEEEREQEELSLPGMIPDARDRSPSLSPSLCRCRRPLSADVTSPSMTSHALSCAVGTEEARGQNRRLLPDYRNELHVIDGEQRYYLGVIDFFTRYTFKKRLENSYKRVIYPPLSFSTVHPDVFAERFRKYWRDHTA